MKINHAPVHHARAAGSVGLVLLAAAAGGAVALGNGPSRPVTDPGAGPIGGPRSASIGNPASLALLSRVQRAYRHAPGIELAAAARATTARARVRRFLLRLQHGTVAAEAFIGPARHGVVLVARRGGSTFLRAAGVSCWRRLHRSNPQTLLKGRAGLLRRLARSDPRTLLNVGAPFPENGKVLLRRNQAGARQLVIETHSAFWFLAGPVTPQTIARKSFLTLTPNPATYAIRSIRVRAPEPAVRAKLTVTPLTAAPSIPRPTPRC